MAVIFDIDGTLADLSHRLHFVSGKSKDYDSFFALVKDDAPHADIIRLANMYALEDKVLLVSGRPEKTRADTVAWMAENGVNFEALYMRADGDFRRDHTVKSQILDGILADGYDISLVVDDRPSVVAMWRERGLTCLQCRDWQESQTHHAETGKLNIMVGPAGAGKSTWLAANVAPALVCSSDSFREQLCGDFRDQTKNDQVFGALHAVVKARLGHGLETYVDATNIRRKDRMSVAATANGGPVTYLVVDRPLDEKRATGGWRNEVKDFDLIGRHDQTFKSNLKDILAGDGLPNVTVTDLRGAL